MEYKISDIAKLFNISKEMVRYYEKCGVIIPKRSVSNNYRVYTDADFFLLAEIIQLQQFGINIKDSKLLMADNFVERMVDSYESCAKNLDSEILQKKLFKLRCEELIEDIEMASLNIDSFWIKRVPERYDYFYQTAHGDEYGKPLLPDDMGEYTFNSIYSAFNDAIVYFYENEEKWSFSVKKIYADALNLDESHHQFVKSQICCCTIIDMGDFGEFSFEKCKPLLEYAKNKNYQITGRIYGVLRGRGMKNGRFCRQMELRLPIQKV